MTVLWHQKTTAFDGQTVETGCTINIETGNENRVTSTIVSATDTEDTCHANITNVAKLPTTKEGRIRFRFEPQSGLPLAAQSDIFLVFGGGSIIAVAFNASGKIILSIGSRLRSAGTQVLTDTSGLTITNSTFYDVEVAWKMQTDGTAYGKMWAAAAGSLDTSGTPLLQSLNLTSAAIVDPGAIQMGILNYAGSSVSGWSNRITYAQIADSATTALNDDAGNTFTKTGLGIIGP